MRLRLAALVTAASMVPAMARAQGAAADGIDASRAGARTHIGPLYVTPQLALKQFGIDNNVFNQPVNPQSDFTVNVSPGVEVALPVARRALLKTTGSADLVYFAHFTSERSVDPRVNTRLETYVRRVTLYGEASVESSRERPNFEIDVRSRRLITAARAGGRLRLSPKTSVDVSGYRETTAYDNGAFAEGVDFHTTLNHSSDGVTVAPRFDVTPYTTLAARIDAFHDQFPFDAARGSSNTRVMPGIEFNPRALISGEAYFGYRRLLPDQPALMPAFEGLVARMGLSYQPLTLTKLSVTFDRDLQYSLETLQPYFVDDSIGASVQRGLGGGVDVLLHAERHLYQYRNYSPAVPGAAALALRADHTLVYQGSIGYRVRRGVRLGFGLTSADRVSPLPGRSYSGVRVGTDLTYGFQQ
ncbi:MAG TPA: outer membrane beta-barrel protein [Vicinamibacterales bacterium]|nr:outer membrane beta-barrel protein [Vicinamibacterales bacterium]